MKRFALLLCLLPISLFAQERNTEEDVQQLKAKIAASEKDKKLVWMDSLAEYMITYTSVQSDSIFKETVSYALQVDSLRIATWHTANLIFIQNNEKGAPAKGKELFLNFLPKVQTHSFDQAASKFYIEGADSHYFLDEHEEAIRFYDSAIVKAIKAKDKRFEGLAKLYKGGSLSFAGEFAEASKILQEAAAIFSETKDSSNILGAKNSLAILYSQNAFFEEAEKERTEAIELAKKMGNNGQLISLYYNAATDARKQGNDKERIQYLKLAIASNEKISRNQFFKAPLYSAMAIAYAQADSLTLAESYLEKMENEVADLEGRNRETYVEALKNFEFAKGSYGRALRYGKEHLEIERSGSHYEEVQEAEKFLADVYERMGNKSAAYDHFKKFEAIKDSLGNAQKIKGLSYYQTLYETEKRDATIEAQQDDIALLDAENRLKNQWIVFGGIGLLLSFGGVLLFRSRRSAEKKRMMQERFSQDLIKAQEEERTRVARELHDSVGQKLMLLTKRTKSSGDPDMETLAGTTLEELRSISRGLHPAALERLGVTRAIESLVNEVDANTPIFFTNEIDNIDDAIPTTEALHLYRIVQEVLSNMVKHAEAKAASVVIEREGKAIHATIKDNGKGFLYSEKMNLNTSLGMKTLMERAKILHSKLAIDSAPNKGTTVKLTIPLP
ncbi:sensor histidine kinase [Flavobacteriaceae bacterium TK19130]|nr:sensor histidine kinase [Thermobacterium salinum]